MEGESARRGSLNRSSNCDMSKEMSNGFGSFSLPRAPRDVRRLPGQDFTTVKERGRENPLASDRKGNYFQCFLPSDTVIIYLLTRQPSTDY